MADLWVERQEDQMFKEKPKPHTLDSTNVNLTESRRE